MGKPKEALAFLYHEREEAYTGDIISPLKHLVKEIVKPIIDNISKITGEWLQLPKDVDYDLMKMVDLNLYEWESMIFQSSSLNYECWDSETAIRKFREQEDICLKFISYVDKELATENNSHNLKIVATNSIIDKLKAFSRPVSGIRQGVGVSLNSITSDKIKELVSIFRTEIERLQTKYVVELTNIHKNLAINPDDQLFITFKFGEGFPDHTRILDVELLEKFCKWGGDVGSAYNEFIDGLFKEK
jgi:hypothetical protein